MLQKEHSSTITTLMVVGRDKETGTKMYRCIKECTNKWHGLFSCCFINRLNIVFFAPHDVKVQNKVSVAFHRHHKANSDY